MFSARKDVSSKQRDAESASPDNDSTQFPRLGWATRRIEMAIVRQLHLVFLAGVDVSGRHVRQEGANFQVDDLFGTVRAVE